MIDIKECKEKARIVFFKNWKPAVGVMAISTIALLLFQLPTLHTSLEIIKNPNFNPNQTLSFINSLIAIMVDGVFTMALSYFFVHFAKQNEKAKFHTFLEGFNLWLHGIYTALWQTLFVSLWTLLFIIPGIIKSLAYSQMYWIVAENPDITATKAMKMSSTMTKGFKMDLFILELSFIGWYALGIITLGIGMLWVEPYVRLSRLNAFETLKKQALETQILSQEDFGEHHR